jgi:hypothetical protein
MISYDFRSLPAKAIQIAENTIEALRAPCEPVVQHYQLHILGDAITVGKDEYLVGQRYGRRKSPVLFEQPATSYAPALYCFSLRSLEDASRVRESRGQLDRTISDRKLPENNVEHELGNCLYVGSSVSRESKVAARLCQHLGFTGGNGTYALYLNRLPLTEPLTLDLSVAWYPGNTSEFVQRLEEAMWDEQAPLFGRRGR